MRPRVALLALAACGAPDSPAPAPVDGAADGFVVRQTALPVAGGPGRLLVVEVPPAARLEVLPAPVPSPLARIADLPAGRTCVAVNGGFYDARGAMGWVVHAGEEAAPLRATGGSGVLLVDATGPAIVHRDAAAGRPREALQSIDRLVDAGRSLVRPNARPDPDARSAVALRADGTVIFAVVFAEQAVARERPGRVELGPASSSTGLSLAAWAELLAAPVADGGLGATAALNLDGGYSTALALRVGDLRLDVVAHAATINALRACGPGPLTPAAPAARPGTPAPG